MNYYTTIQRTANFPCYDEKISITGKYCLDKNDTSAYFISAQCPIIENAKLPTYDQLENYKYLQCTHEHGSCVLSKLFPDTIDL